MEQPKADPQGVTPGKGGRQLIQPAEEGDEAEPEIGSQVCGRNQLCK